MKTKKLLFFMIYVSLVISQTNAQGIQPRTWIWSDGSPSFHFITDSTNVRVGAAVSLIPTPGFFAEPDSFRMILNVIDSTWAWPPQVAISSAGDIEQYIDNDGDHYVITDVAGGRVIDLVLSSPELVWIFEGQVGTPRYLNNPVDTYVYKVDDEPIFLITDQGGHRVIKVDRYRNSIIWQYGDGSEGNGFNQLYYPSDAVALPESSQVLICDKGNNRVIIVNEADTTIAWEWGSGNLDRPVDIEYNSVTREVLITDQGNNRVIKVSTVTDSIIWQFDDGLANPSDADFLPNGNVLICDKDNNRLIEVNFNQQLVWQLQSELENLADVDRLSNNKHLIISNGQPARIGYITQDFISARRYLGREVSFDSLFWTANTIPGLTSIQLQLRSENTSADLETAPWQGPTAGVPIYTNPASKINTFHNGHKFYQFKATLQTSDPLYTPVLNGVRVTYNFYDTEVTGIITSNVIRDPDEYIITRWKSLKFNTILPPNPMNRDKVEIKITILDDHNNPLRSFIASKVDSTNEVSLEGIASLKQRQAIRLQAAFSTISTAATPRLSGWEVQWEATPATNASIQFVDQQLESVPFYHVTQSGEAYIDRVSVLLDDPNLVPMQDVVNLNLISLASRDTQQVSLALQPEGWFLIKPSLPAVISDTVIINDGILQVFDRDRLVISYQDPIVATDQASDTVLMVQNTEGTVEFLEQDPTGTIQLGNITFTKIDTATVGDTIYVHIMGEKDRDLTVQQDRVVVTVFDYETSDEESLLVVELPDDSGAYETGEFLSSGIKLVRGISPARGDSVLQTFGGSRVGVDYEDTIGELPVLQITGPLNIPSESYAGVRALDFDMAPNPYFGDRHNLLRIRVASSIDDITIEKIEVYNFAGQKIREIGESQLNFYTRYPIPVQEYGYADSWWNLKDQNGTQVSSGTYFVKVIAKVVNTNKTLSHIKKLVIVR